MILPVRSEMDSLTLRVRLLQTLREYIVQSLMPPFRQLGGPKIFLTQWFYFWFAITNVDGGIYILICYCMVSMNFPISTQALRDSGSILAAIWNTWNMPS